MGNPTEKYEMEIYHKPRHCNEVCKNPRVTQMFECLELVLYYFSSLMFRTRKTGMDQIEWSVKPQWHKPARFTELFTHHELRCLLPPATTAYERKKRTCNADAIFSFAKERWHPTAMCLHDWNHSSLPR